MVTQVSVRVLAVLARGKYTRWAEQLPLASLEALLCAVGAFGEGYHDARRAFGRRPEPVFEAHGMAEWRMTRALHTLALLQEGGASEAWLPDGTEMFPDPGPAFTTGYRAKLESSDPLVRWAATMDERALWTLLWQADEYAVRVNSSWKPDRHEFPPPMFDPVPSQEARMRRALRLLALICRRARCDLPCARRFIEESGVGVRLG